MKHDKFFDNTKFIFDDAKYDILVNSDKSDITTNDYICKFRKKHIHIFNYLLNSNHFFGQIKVDRQIDFIRLVYNADVGECYAIKLYKKDYAKSQKFYYDQVDIWYTHDWMDPKYKQIKK